MIETRNSQFNSSSKDAMTVAPCSCTAKSEVNIKIYSGIAFAMSVLLCLAAIISNALEIIIGIFILNILLICVKWIKEKAVGNLI